MKRCDCGGSIEFFSFYPVCPACLQEYLQKLPERPGFTINEFQIERQREMQSRVARMTINPASRRVRLLGTAIDPITSTEAMKIVENFVEQGVPRQLVTVNVDFVKIAQENDRFRQIVNSSDLSVADGKPLLWAARWTGQELPGRITGMDLVLGSAELAVRRDETMFLLGAAEGVAAQAAAILRSNYPGLKVHAYSPPMGPFSDEENARMVDMIRQSGAKYLFVAFGAPKQDVWINEHLHELEVPVCAGIGGVLNFLAGSVKRAPQWMQQFGLEWLYRVIQEPARLWRRYFMEDLPVFARMLMEPVALPVGSVAQVGYEPLAARLPVSNYERAAQPHVVFERAVSG